MKVYIIYQSDGYNGSMVDKIFLSKECAVDYVWNKVIGKEHPRQEAEEFVYEEDVVE